MAENWVGYEGNFRHSHSDIEISGNLEVAWEQRFDELVDIIIDGPGHFQSRNLAIYNGMLALVANVDPNPQNDRGHVVILDASDGNVLNCIRTLAQGGYPSHDMWDAVETFPGEYVIAWDPDTEILFMSIGSDHPNHVGVLPLANMGSFDGTNALAAAGAWEWMAAYPDFQSNRYNLELERYAYRRDEDSILTGSQPQRYDEWDAHVGGAMRHAANRVSFFDVQPGSPWIVSANGSSHNKACGTGICNKYTGRHAGEENDKSLASQLANMPVWKRFPGLLVDGEHIYFLGPYDPDISANPDDWGNSDKGINIKCIEFEELDQRGNDGYTGRGAAETANKVQTTWHYQIESTGTSWDEDDLRSRNKAWFTADGEVWLTWKQSQADNVELVNFNASSYTQYDLGVGANRVYISMFPSISYADVGADGKYIVYYLSSNDDASERGPITLTVFDTAAGSVVWSYELQNTDLTGNYPDLPFSPDYVAGSVPYTFTEMSRMITAGKYAYVAWVDTTGTGDAVLKLVSFDITAPSAPATPPVPFEYTLTGADTATVSKTRLIDLAAVDGMIYALITEDDDVSSDGLITAQRVVAIAQEGRPTASASVTPTSGEATLVVYCDGSASTDGDGSIVSWEWDFGDGETAATVTASHSYDTAGSYNIRLTVTDNDGKSHTTITSASVTEQSDESSVIIESDGDGTIKDTTLKDNGVADHNREDDGARNWESMYVRQDSNNSRWRYGLIKFDISSIPAGVTIESAELKMTAVSATGTKGVTAYAMNEAWNLSYTCFNYKDNSTWWNDGSTPFDPTGAAGDFDSSASASTTVTGGIENTWDVTTIVSEWYAATRDNHGLALLADDDGTVVELRTVNYTVSDQRPRLVVSISGGSVAGDGSVEIVNPDGGETYSGGAAVTINWTSSGLTGDVTLDLIASDGTTVAQSIGTTTNDGEHTWTLPAVGSDTDYYIRITGSDGTDTYTDMSDAVFTVTAGGTDGTAPTVNVSSVDITGTVTDASVIDEVTVAGSAVTVTSGNWTAADVALGGTATDISISAQDAGGNSSAITLSVSY